MPADSFIPQSADGDAPLMSFITTVSAESSRWCAVAILLQPCSRA
ncbi:MAG: hypothetical protein ACD_47C00207G0001, partial [uncultured bacterium]